jgi:hypothetical protein
MLKRLLLTIGLFAALVNVAAAQTVPLGPRFVLPFQTVVDATGVPIPGAQLFFYSAGTNTPLNTYSDPLLTVANPNPVQANGAGVFPTVFLSGNYKVVLTDGAVPPNQLWTANNVYSGVVTSASLDALCGVNNDSLVRLSGTWQCMAYSSQFTVGTTLGIKARTVAAGNTSYYVNGNSGGTAACGPTGALTCAAGNDSNDCLTPETACLTTQHLAGFSATIFLAHGSSSNYAFTCTGGPVIGQSVFGINGDNSATTAVTIVAPALAAAAAVKDGCTVSITSVAFADSASHNAAAFISAGTGGYGHVDANNLTFGALGIGTAMAVSYAGSITTGNLAVTGSENAFIDAANGGAVEIDGTVTGSAGITWGTAGVVIQQGGVVAGISPSTFSGFSGVSGPRCFISSLTSPDGYNPNVLYPGSTDCVVNITVGALGLQKGSGGSSTLDYGLSGQCVKSGGGSGVLNTWAPCAGSGVPQNNLNTQSGNYTVQTTDCGNTINATGAQKTITLPSVSGFASNCVLAVYNANSTRGQILSGFPGALAAAPSNILWPLDTITVQIVNGAWSLQSYPARHKITAAITLFVDNTNGNDANDCLATTTGACKTRQGAFNYINTWDGNEQAILVSVAAGTYTANLTQNGPFHGNPTVTLQGDLSTPSNILISTTSADALDMLNGASLTMGGFKIVTTTGGNGISVGNASFLNITGAMEYGSVVNSQLQAKTGSTITITADYTISGGANIHWQAIQGAQIISSGSRTITLTGTPAFGQSFASASTGGLVGVLSTTYSGSATGPSFVASTNGFVNNGSGSALPGSLSTSTILTHGYVGQPGTPSISSCGTSPSAATGTDLSGHVTEGTTATGCTITFSTGTTFNSCTVSLSTGAAVGVSTLGSTLVVTHASLSNNVLYWTCAN